MNTGKQLEKKFRDWHKGLNCYTFKFPDNASSGTTQKALCDRVTISNGKVYWFELKHTESKTSFSFSLIKDHQWASMLKLRQHGTSPYFLIEDGNHQTYLISPEGLLFFYKNGKSVKFAKMFHFLITKQNYIERFIYT